MQAGIAPERRHICRRGILSRSGAGAEGGRKRRAQGTERRAQAKRLRDLGTKRPDFKLRRSELFVVQGISLENAPEQADCNTDASYPGAMETG